MLFCLISLHYANLCSSSLYPFLLYLDWESMKVVQRQHVRWFPRWQGLAKVAEQLLPFLHNILFGCIRGLKIAMTGSYLVPGQSIGIFESVIVFHDAGVPDVDDPMTTGGDGRRPMNNLWTCKT